MLGRIIYNIVSVILGYLLADFIVGIYHWFKDSYFTPHTPIIGKRLIWGSRLHHIRPRYVIEFSDHELFLSSAKWTLLWMGPLFYLLGFNVFLVILFLTISLNDVIHKYAHMSDQERPAWTSFLQRKNIFQSHDEHHLHHISPHEINYCPITPYVNVVLEKINFWKKLEKIVKQITGVDARSKITEFVEDEKYPAGIRFLE